MERAEKITEVVFVVSSLPAGVPEPSGALFLQFPLSQATVPVHSRFQEPSKWPQERSKCLPAVPQTFNFAHHYDTLATFPTIASKALELLLGSSCWSFWTPWGSSWAPLGLSRGALGPHLEPLGPKFGPPKPLLASTWRLLGAPRAQLGSHRANFGRHWATQVPSKGF